MAADRVVTSPRFNRGDEIAYIAYPLAERERGFVERDDGGPLVLCRFWRLVPWTPRRELRTTANGERVPREKLFSCPSGDPSQVARALATYCAPEIDGGR